MRSPAFIGRWTPKIPFSLKEGPRRRGELRRAVGGVSQRMLTRTLRNLESTGLIARRITRSKPIAVEYSLSKDGKTIVGPLTVMCRWTKRYGTVVTADVHVPEQHRTPISRARQTRVPDCSDAKGLANCGRPHD